MLLTKVSRRPPPPQLNMTPMIDVIFQLLIFFLCTTSVLIEKELETQTPRASRGKPAAADDLGPIRVRLSGGASGVSILCDREMCADFESLVKRLTARRAAGDIPVIIEGQGAVPFRFMVSALDACHRADLHRVAFSAKGAIR